MSVRIKICGVTNEADVECALDAGADYLGFILVPGTPRCVSLAQVKELVRCVAGRAQTVGVFRNEPAVVQMLKKTRLNIAQLHGTESAEEVKRIGAERVWKVVKLESEEDVERASDFEAALVLADSPGGGTGRVCDWRLAAALSAKRPMMLAGGLNPENVAEAVRQVMPWGVDVSSGVERVKRLKDHEKIRAFVRQVRELQGSLHEG